MEDSGAARKGLNNEPAWKTQGVGVGKDVYGLKEVSETTTGHFKPGEEDVAGNDWQKSAGDFECIVCRRKRLPASEFSKKQVEKALEGLRSIPDKDIREGPDIQRVVHVSAVCKKCMIEREEKEREEGQARRAEREKLLADREQLIADAPPPEPARRTAVSLADRPFGMTPGKAEGTGYLVVKVSDGKPAVRAGVRPGWRVVCVAGQSCEDADLEQVQQLLKAADLPVEVVFDEVPGNYHLCTACQKILTGCCFSRKMLTKAPETRRCTNCVEASQAEADGGAAEKAEAAPQGKLSELQALCAETAQQAEQVSGLKAVRGGSSAGRGRGGRR